MTPNLQEKQLLADDFNPNAPDLTSRRTTTPAELKQMIGKGQMSVEAAERYLGMGAPQAKPKGTPSKNISRVFNLSRGRDAEEFNALINNPKMSIIQFKENWGQDGSFRAWVLYSEQLELTSKDNGPSPLS